MLSTLSEGQVLVPVHREYLVTLMSPRKVLVGAFFCSNCVFVDGSRFRIDADRWQLARRGRAAPRPDAALGVDGQLPIGDGKSWRAGRARSVQYCRRSDHAIRVGVNSPARSPPFFISRPFRTSAAVPFEA